MLHCPTGGVWVVPDGLQIGKSNENTCVFIDFQGIQVGPGGWPRREAHPKGGGKRWIRRPVTSNQFAVAVGSLLDSLGTFWRLLEAFWKLLECFWRILGTFWRRWGTFLRLWGTFWVLLGTFWRPLGTCWRLLGTCWRLLGTFWGTLGDLLGTPGGLLIPPGGLLAALLSHWRRLGGARWSPDREK